LKKTAAQTEPNVFQIIPSPVILH